MTTPILGIPELSNGMVDQFAVVNEGFRLIESSMNSFLDCELSTESKSLTVTEIQQNFLFVAKNNAVARDLVFLARKRFFAIRNSGTATLNIKLGATTLTLAAAGSGFYFTDGTANGLFKIG